MSFENIPFLFFHSFMVVLYARPHIRHTPQVVGHSFDSFELASSKQPQFETIDSLMSTISPGYLLAFLQAVSQQLSAVVE